jgi:YD repeat-containing protein
LYGLLIQLTLAFIHWPLHAAYECSYDEVTVDPTDPYLTCVTTCQTQLHWVPPNNMLSCNFLHQQKWCSRYCADAEEDVCEGNPIQLSSGAKLHAETDYQGAGEYPLTLRRYYSTAWTMPDGHWGERWLGTDSPRVVSVNTDNEGDIYTVVRPNGKYLKFTWISGGGGATRPIKPDTEGTLTLYEHEDSHIMVLRLPGGTHEVYDFDLQAFAADRRYTSRLLWTKWRGGLRHTYAYDSEGRLETITHSNGQQLQFFYDPQDRVERVAAPGELSYRYAYDTVGNLVSVT